jgi:parallel beta-helix repeat protein
MSDQEDPSTDRLALLAGVGGLVACILLTAGRADAGPLNPLAPPASTAKPLAEVEPRTAINGTNTPGDADSLYRITLPGSYYLTGNVEGKDSMSGIEIALGQSGEVTIDLAGFQLLGESGTLSGIDVTGAFLPIINIRNGGVIGWDGHGIDLTGMEGGVIEGVSLMNNVGTGMIVTKATVRDCLAMANNDGGMSIGDGTTITNCIARNNTGIGINSTSDCVIVACTAYLNNGNGFGASGSTLRDCTSTLNTFSGYFVNNGTIAVNCRASTNVLSGFIVASDSKVLQCVSDNNGLGSGGAGIRVDGNDNRIEQNNCTDNARGIHVTAVDNFITRNTCSGNTTLNWDIVAGNICLVVNAAATPAISGNSGGASPGSTNPNANYTY